MNNVILVDTGTLQSYADRLKKVNTRLARLDWDINGLYFYASANDMYWLRKSDRLIGYKYSLRADAYYLEKTSVSLSKCEQKLLKQDPISFEKPAETLSQKVKKELNEYGHAVRKTAKNIGRSALVFTAKLDKKIGEVTTRIAQSYYSQGTVYDVVQYGKAVLRGAKGIGKIIAGVVSIAGSGGMSTPVSILSIISGANDVLGAVMDWGAVRNGDYDSVGFNYLKDTMTESFGVIGEKLGYKEAGEKAGELLYHSIDILTSVESIDLALDKFGKIGGFKIKDVASELKQIGKTETNTFLNTKISELGTLVKNTGEYYVNTKNAVKLTSASYKLFDKSMGLLKKAGEAAGFENPAIELYSKVTKPINTISKISKICLA